MFNEVISLLASSQDASGAESKDSIVHPYDVTLTSLSQRLNNLGQLGNEVPKEIKDILQAVCFFVGQELQYLSSKAQGK